MNAVLTEREKHLVDLLSRNDGSLLIAGIPECRTALALVERGVVRIDDGAITQDGGSGHVSLTGARS